MYDLMDQYLTGQLSGQERKTFEQELQTNMEFAKEYKMYQTIAGGVKAHGDRTLKVTLQNMHTDMLRQGSKPKIRSIGYRYAIAASILMVLALGVWYLSQPVASDNLFAEYYAPYETSLANRDVTENKWVLAENAYLEKDYLSAKSQLEQLLASGESTPQLILALGICHLELDETSLAIEQFNVLINNKDPFLYDQAVWYTALSHLKNASPENALPLLEELRNDPNADQHDSAVRLLKAMNK